MQNMHFMQNIQLNILHKYPQSNNIYHNYIYQLINMIAILKNMIYLLNENIIIIIY